MKTAISTALAIAVSLAVAACGGSAPPPAYPAADNGQPRMQAALVALQRAQSEANAAEANKGGHRERALPLIQQAIDQVNAGIQYAAEHPTEVGEAGGPAEPEPVSEEVAGGAAQPHMAAAIVALREAHKQLRDAKHDKGGHRAQALALIRQASEQLRDGMRFA